ncbi:MAG: PAS domain S-box protein [Coriobacteriia bacterium]
MPGWLVWMTVVGVLTVVAGGVLYAINQEQTIRHRSESTLATIAKLKADQIAHWRTDRIIDGGRALRSPTAGEVVSRLIDQPRDVDDTEILAWLEANTFGGRYQAATLTDLDGTVLASTLDTGGSLDPAALAEVKTAINERRTILTSIHALPVQLGPHIDVIAPILRPDTGTTMAILVLHASTHASLQYLVADWPAPSDSAELLLIERDADDSVILCDARFMEDPTAAIRVPLSQTGTVAVKAVLDGEGIVEGLDYRGIPVIAYATPIEDSDWYLVAAVDADEALADWPRRRTVVIIFTLIGVIALIAIVMLIEQRIARAGREAQRALEAAEHAAQERLATTMRSIGDAVISTDAARRIEFMNPVAEELTGWSLENAAGVALSDVFVIINEETREPVASPVDIVLRDRVVVGLANHTILVSRAGTERAIADSAAPILGDSGEITGVVLVFRDQTEERAASKALKDSEERFRSLVDDAPDAIFVQTGGRFAYVNDAMCDLLGAASREELIGRPVTETVHPDYRDLAIRRIKGLNEGRARQSITETVFLRSDGREVRAETSGSPIVYGEPGALVFVRDITERKAAEEELARYRYHLEYLVTERTSEIEAANVEIEAANHQLYEANIELENATNAKSAFLASMSHELRTPLNAIIGFSEILAQGMVGPLSEDQHEKITIIKKSGLHLLSLINDVLDLSKIEAGKIETRAEPFDPGALTCEIAETIRPLAEEKELELHVDAPSDGRLLHSDEGKVRQILLNLAGNAVKFTAAGSVRITFRRGTTGPAVFEVTDTGYGIAQDDIPKIFEAFSQVEQGDVLRPEGTGLGLALSQQLARLIGGEVTVRSEVGAGSTFRLTLPDLV